MFKRTMAAAFAIMIVMSAGVVLAQTCTVAAYADAAGTSQVIAPTQGVPFDVYVVLFTEDRANAVSYRLDVPGLNSEIFIMNSTWGPEGDGLNFQTANGANVGLGECAIGFGGYPILVATYTMLIPLETQNDREITVLGNADENINFPVYNTCDAVLKTCDSGPALYVDQPVANESASFGAVKSLYGN